MVQQHGATMSISPQKGWDLQNDPFASHAETPARKGSQNAKQSEKLNQSTDFKRLNKGNESKENVNLWGTKYAPDGTEWTQSQWKVEHDEDGEVVVRPESETIRHSNELVLDERGWYEAENQSAQEAQFARRNFHILGREVSQRFTSGRCPSGRWTNDPKAFPLLPPLAEPDGSPIPSQAGGVQPFPPDSKQFFCPIAQEAGTTKLEVQIEGSTHRMRHTNHMDFQGAVMVAIAQNPDEPENPFATQKLGYMPELLFRESTEFLNFKANKLFFGAYILTRAGIRHDFQGDLPAEAFQKEAFYGEVTMNEVLGSRDTPSQQGRGDAVLLRVNVKAVVREAINESSKEPSERTRKMLEHKQEIEMVPWCRLTEYGAGAHGSLLKAAHVFNDDLLDATDCGRVLPGHLHNAYLVEALNAISTRPVVARQIFYCWDVAKAIYVLRLMINGTWVRVEIDDYIPPVPVLQTGDGEFDEKPICCHSEWFPWVLWPSLVEKAYAKVRTIRPPYGNKGGWEALGGAGRVEEALADLTGGVAGRFSTRDVSPDRLFVYFYWLQRHCLWVARMNEHTVTVHGLPMNQYSSYVVKRAAHLEGHCYVQLFHAGLDRQLGGGIEAHVVPDAIIDAFPEKGKGNYSWMSIYDFCEYFNWVIECRLVNSPDAGLPGMPPPTLPVALAMQPPHMRQPNDLLHSMDQVHIQDMKQPLFYEHVLANRGTISKHNLPEFNIYIPEQRSPCEVAAVLSQTDTNMPDALLEEAIPILLKVYQHIDGNNYNVDMVCRSNWIAIRDSMVCFYVKRGGQYKVVAEFPPEDGLVVRNLVFRCYTSQAGCQVTGSKNLKAHSLVQDNLAARFASKWTLVGCANPKRMLRTDEPEPFDAEDGAGSGRGPDDDDQAKCSLM